MPAILSRISNVPTPWAVQCNGDYETGNRGCGQVFLTEDEYSHQLLLANRMWQCPMCERSAYWDDDNYEKFLNDNTYAGVV